MEFETVLVNLTNLIQKEFGVTILDPDISLFSTNYNFSTMDVLYIIYSYIEQNGKKMNVKPSMKKYSPNEISEWLLKNER